MTPFVTAAPVSSAAGVVSTRSRPPSPFLRKSSKYNPINTALMTPTFTSIASPTTSSLTSSPTTASIQSSPEGPRGRDPPFHRPPAPLHLPESTMPASPTPTTPLPSSMGETMALSKGPGLIRRISRGAANKFAPRRRQSSNSISRDHSSGPVIMRRRSGSKIEAELDLGALEPGMEGDNEEEAEEALSLYGLGLSVDGTNGAVAETSASRKYAYAEGGIDPVVPLILQNGTVMTKVVKNKRKKLTFVLDTKSAKVLWNPVNPTKQFYIDDIQDIRLREDARNYREEFQIPVETESRWFTIIYADQDRAKGRPVKTMHIIAPDQYLFDLWTTTLEEIWRYRHELMSGLAGSGQDEVTLRVHWRREMAKRFGDGPRSEDAERLDLAGVETLCRSLHMNCSTNVIRFQFEQAATDQAATAGLGFLNFDGFKDFVRRLKERSEVMEIYRMLAGQRSEGIDQEIFFSFLHNMQGLDVAANPARWHEAFAKFVKKHATVATSGSDASNGSRLLMGYEAFAAFLSSAYNTIRKPFPTEARLHRPLNEYFISSSHNTYLLGRQVAGNSSTEPYRQALRRGCRCVEIDCWDGPDVRPIVSHGRTMTTSVPFADCISVIAKFAFESTPYPLILSLEVHCNAEQQQAMVDIMIKELGDRLVREPDMANASVLPSPEDLRYRILVKVKAGENVLDKDMCSPVDTTIGSRQRSFSSPFSRPQALDNSYLSNLPPLSSPQSMSSADQISPVWSVSRSSTGGTSASSATDDSDIAQRNTAKLRRRTAKRKKSKIIPSLGNLGVYTRGLKFEDFTVPESKSPNHVFSMAEKQFETLCRESDSLAQLEKHNLQHLMRVYPSPFRMKSTNPDPLVFWRRGTQMVALNWQTYDLGMQINDAMFGSGSDRTGYVLKPKELRLPDPSFLPRESHESLVPKKLVQFSVDMISAQQLPQPRNAAIDESIDPYVEIEMFSAEGKGKGFSTPFATPISEGSNNQDTSSIRSGSVSSGISNVPLYRPRTSVVQCNGFNPVFNEHFKFSVETKCPSLVFVRWTVWDSQDGRNYNASSNSGSSNTWGGPLATFTARLDSLQQGYRHLPLYDHNGERFFFATLFCKIMMEEPVVVAENDAMVDQTPGGAEKVGRLRQLGQAVFKRTVSIERKNSKDE